MNKVSLHGKVLEIGPTKTVGSNLQIRELLLETAERTPQQVPVQFLNKHIAKVDRLSVGVTVKISARVRTYYVKASKRRYVNLHAFYAEPVEQAAKAAAAFCGD